MGDVPPHMSAGPVRRGRHHGTHNRCLNGDRSWQVQEGAAKASGGRPLLALQLRAFCARGSAPPRWLTYLVDRG
jgi:hypothetical protein